MQSILEQITDWLKSMIISGIMGNLSRSSSYSVRNHARLGYESRERSSGTDHRYVRLLTYVGFVSY